MAQEKRRGRGGRVGLQGFHGKIVRQSEVILCKVGRGNFWRRTGPLGCIDIQRRVTLGVNFCEVKERGATDTGCLLATSDTEIGKIGPSPSGCGENRLILRCRPSLGIA